MMIFLPVSLIELYCPRLSSAIFHFRSFSSKSHHEVAKDLVMNKVEDLVVEWTKKDILAMSRRLRAFTSFFLQIFSSAVEGTIIFNAVDGADSGAVTGIVSDFKKVFMNEYTRIKYLVLVVGRRQIINLGKIFIESLIQYSGNRSDSGSKGNSSFPGGNGLELSLSGRTPKRYVALQSQRKFFFLGRLGGAGCKGGRREGKEKGWCGGREDGKMRERRRDRDRRSRSD
ncbi:hypothetical protein Tco_1204886 [Tanacetum coccineum]